MKQETCVMVEILNLRFCLCELEGIQHKGQCLSWFWSMDVDMKHFYKRRKVWCKAPQLVKRKKINKIHAQDGIPSIKRQEDATQLFIQPFIGPSCATPGLPFGIWSSLHNQKNSPSSDKRGVFLLMCSAKKGVAGVPHQAFSSIQRKMELKEYCTRGISVWGCERWRKRGKTLVLAIHHILHIFSVVSQYRHTDTEVGCQAACRPQKRQRAESRGGGGGNVDMKEVSNVALARHPKHDINTVSLHSTQSQIELLHTPRRAH